MKKLFLRSAFAVATAAALTLTMAPAAQAAPAKPSPTTVQNYVLAKTNEARVKAKLRPLVLNKYLNTIAQDCSIKQARNATMAHCLDYYKKYPAGWRSASENVAYGYDYKAVVDAWLKSPGHRKNILSNATDIGIGVNYDNKGLPYYTQDFGQYALFNSVVNINGTAKVNGTLKAQAAGYPKGTKISYLWYANGNAVGGESSLKVSKFLAGKSVKVTVTATKAGYSAETKSSRSVTIKK